MPQLKIVGGVLDVIELDGVERLAIRGLIDPHSLQDIKVPPYQREVLSQPKIKALKDALKHSRVPEVDLGMRGDLYDERPKGIFYLNSDVFVIDGLQRVTAGKELVASEEAFPYISAVVHFDTTENWERERFTALNTGQTGLSNNVMLRNLAGENAGAAVIYRITQDKGFVLGDKVAWTQNMHKGDLLTAITFYKVVGRLMSHAGPGRSGPVSIASGGADKIIKKVGRNNFIANVKSFFTLVDETFGVASVAYRNQAVQLKASFLLALAGVVSDHENWWDGDRLEVPTDLKRRLALFPISDGTVVQLAGSAGKAISMLEYLLIDHLNTRKSTRKLRRRKTAQELLVPAEFENGDEDE